MKGRDAMKIVKQFVPISKGVSDIELPYRTVEEARAAVRHLEWQGEMSYVWYEDNEAEAKRFIIVVIGTGDDWGNILKRAIFVYKLMQIKICQ